MCGAQQLLCNPELAQQIVGAHQPHQACSRTLFRKHSHTRVEEGAQQLGQLSHTVRTLRPMDCGSLFNFWVWSGGGGTAIILATRLNGICNASHNRMEEGAHLGLLATVQPHSLGTGDKCPPPCFRVLFGNIQQFSILIDQTTGDLKSHHLQAEVTAVSVPPPFLSAVHVFFKWHSQLLRGARQI